MREEFAVVPTGDTRIYAKAKTIQDVEATMRLVTKSCVEQIALVIVRLEFTREVMDGQEQSFGLNAYMEASIHYYLDRLRPLVRKTDIVFRQDNMFHFLLPGATLESGRIVQERLWDALLWCIHHITDKHIIPPSRMYIGHSAYPSPSVSLKACIAAASETCIDFVHFKTFEQSGERKQSIGEEQYILAQQFGIPYLASLPRQIPKTVAKVVSPELARELQIYPLGRANNVLTVAMTRPPDEKMLEMLTHKTGFLVFPVLVPPQELNSVLYLDRR